MLKCRIKKKIFIPNGIFSVTGGSMKVVCKLSFKGCYSCYDFASDYVLNQLKGEQVAVPDVF